jgi:hypothetical protein
MSGAAAAAATSESQRAAHLAPHRTTSLQLQQQHERRQLHALMSAGQLPPYSQPGALSPPGQLLPPATQPSLDVQTSLQQQLSTADMAGLAALAANLLGGGSGIGRSAAAPTPEAEPSRVAVNRLPSFNSRMPPQPSTGVSGMLPAPVAGAAAAGGGAPLQQLLLLQLLQAQIGGDQGAQPGGGLAALPSLVKSEPVVAAIGASTDGADFLMECLRCGGAQAAH